MGKCKCRASYLAKQDGGSPGKHVIKKANFYCPFCEKNIVNYSDHFSGDYSGHSYECMTCRSYVFYTSDIDEPWKEEFYFDDLDIVMINEFSDDETLLWCIKNDEKVLSCPKIKFTDKNKIKEKIKKYILFS